MMKTAKRLGEVADMKRSRGEQMKNTYQPPEGFGYPSSHEARTYAYANDKRISTTRPECANISCNTRLANKRRLRCGKCTRLGIKE